MLSSREVASWATDHEGLVVDVCLSLTMSG
jgi:hypothetical protein